MSSRTLMVALGALMLFAPQAASADNGAEACIHNALGDAFASGFVTHSVRAAPLEAGGTRQFSVTLQGGSEYALQSCGSDGELELMLYDTNGHVVARSSAGAGPASITYSPASSRRYHVVAYARDGSQPAAREVSVAVAYR